MNDTVKTETEAHPADALAAALNRASVLLAALIDLYESDNESFVGGNAFIVHGVSTAHELLDEAGRALADLHDRCDLTVVNTTSDFTPPPSPIKVETADALPPLPSMTTAAKTVSANAKPDTQAALHYRELLGKIAKVEANGAMAHSTAQSTATAELLPMLRALRKEIQKASGTA